MRIAFISFEAPPDTLYGGIGTYVGQAAAALASGGHEVEVFTGTGGPARTWEANGYLTHLLPGDLSFEGRLRFTDVAGAAFAHRHRAAPFDVLEGPEYLAEALGAKLRVPEIPFVVKLHMSMTLIRRINRPPLSAWGELKDGLKARLQPWLQLRRWKDHDYPALERPQFARADEIVAPCRAIADVTAEMWQLDRAAIAEVPYPFVPAASLLQVPVATATQTVGYIGRLEQRKGVIDLAEAIPLILGRHPGTRFLFAGATQSSPVPGRTMQEFLEARLARWADRVTFLGRVPPEKMAGVFARMDICVLPSLWENFPNACLEAMAAGRGVVGSRAGGMEQQLAAGEAGRLIDPESPGQIVDQVCRLLEHPAERQEIGARARARVLSEYNARRISGLMVESYTRAMRKRNRAPVAAVAGN